MRGGGGNQARRTGGTRERSRPLRRSAPATPSGHDPATAESALSSRARPSGGGTAMRADPRQAEARAVADDHAERSEGVAQSGGVHEHPGGVGGVRPGRAPAAHPRAATRSSATAADHEGRSTPASSSGRAAARETVDRPRRLPPAAAPHRLGITQHVAHAQARDRRAASSASPRRRRRRPPGSSRPWPAGRRPRPTPARRASGPGPATPTGCAGWTATAARRGAGCKENSGSSTRPPSSAATRAIASAPPLVSSSRLGVDVHHLGEGAARGPAGIGVPGRARRDGHGPHPWDPAPPG